MATDNVQENKLVPPKKLWFGFATSAVAWVIVGIGEIIIEWRTCVRYGQETVPPGHGLARALSLVLTSILLAIAAYAGVTSYRNWERLRKQPELLETLAEDRREFMAVMGLFISLTLGVGILLQALPALIITLCQRAR